MASFGNLDNPVDEVLSAYFRQCAIAMSCAALARAALPLAFDGVDPVSGERILTKLRSRRINALMMTCGHYDGSGDFAFRIGLPGKSGVGGGIVAIVPARRRDHGLVAGAQRAGHLLRRLARAGSLGRAHRLVGLRINTVLSGRGRNLYRAGPFRMGQALPVLLRGTSADTISCLVQRVREA